MIKMPNFYRVMRFIFTPIYKFYYNPVIRGKENIPKSGPIILASNHIHLMDQFNIIISTKRFITFMAKDEYFKKKSTAWFFKAAGCIPVDRTTKDDYAKTRALNVLKENSALGIFPEGTRNKTSKFLLPLKFGVVSLAKKTNALVVPIATTGFYKFRSKNLYIKIGKPFSVENMSLEEANDKLYKEIERMMKSNLKESNLSQDDFRKKYDQEVEG